MHIRSRLTECQFDSAEDVTTICRSNESNDSKIKFSGTDRDRACEQERERVAWERETQINLCISEIIAFADFFSFFFFYYRRYVPFLCASLVVFNSVIRFIGFCAFHVYSLRLNALLIQWDGTTTVKSAAFRCASVICIRVPFYIHAIDWPRHECALGAVQIDHINSLKSMWVFAVHAYAAFSSIAVNTAE